MMPPAYILVYTKYRFLVSVQKSNAFRDSDIQLFIEELGTMPVLLEPSNLRSAGIMLAHNKSTMIGSDVKDWNNYNDAKLPELKIPFSGFKQFVKLLKKDISTIETFVQGKYGEEVHIKPDQYPDCDVKLKIYNDVNIIFGGKGTGKTELILAEIQKHFEKKDTQIFRYIYLMTRITFKNLMHLK